MKEEKKRIFDFLEENVDWDMSTILSFVELLDEVIDEAKAEKERSYDGELQRLYHQVFKEAIEGARNAFVSEINKNNLNEEQGQVDNEADS